MEFVVVFFLIVLFALLVPKPPDLNNIQKFVAKEKVCPPHKWSWIPIVDKDGTQHGERMVCKLCGPLRNGDDS